MKFLNNQKGVSMILEIIAVALVIGVVSLAVVKVQNARNSEAAKKATGPTYANNSGNFTINGGCNTKTPNPAVNCGQTQKNKGDNHRVETNGKCSVNPSKVHGNSGTITLNCNAKFDSGQCNASGSTNNSGNFDNNGNVNAGNVDGGSGNFSNNGNVNAGNVNNSSGNFSNNGKASYCSYNNNSGNVDANQ